MIKTRLVGAYNAANVMAALAVGARFGVPVADAAAAIAAYEPANNRSQMTRTDRNTLIVDAYNANPSSMRAALDNFASVQAPSKIALLGDMRSWGRSRSGSTATSSGRRSRPTMCRSSSAKSSAKPCRNSVQNRRLRGLRIPPPSLRTCWRIPCPGPSCW